MTWLELYNVLHRRANDIKNLDSDLWQQEVLCHNAETGEEMEVENFVVNGKTVLAFNTNSLYNEE